MGHVAGADRPPLFEANVLNVREFVEMAGAVLDVFGDGIPAPPTLDFVFERDRFARRRNNSDLMPAALQAIGINGDDAVSAGQIDGSHDESDLHAALPPTTVRGA